MKEFAHAFDRADVVFVTDIYPAGEPEIPGVSAEVLTDAIRAAGHPAVKWVGRKDELLDRVVPALQEGDLVVTLGAGDIWKAGPQLLERLKTREA
jgi:UDP-N-acetylmuramate--alanine ligase